MDYTLIVFSAFLAIVQAGSLDSLGVGIRIAGGQDATKGEFPYLVSTSWHLPPVAKLDDICGGVILNKSWILTTANCLYLKPVYVTLRLKAGQHRFANPEPKEQVAIVEKRILHENFDMQSASNNIAPLKLKKPLKLSANVAAIKLPQADGAVTDNVTPSGWGIAKELAYPNVLQKLNATLDNIRDWRKTFEGIAGNVTVSLEKHFATATPPAKAVCIGYTGVPLISNVPGKTRNVVQLIQGHCILVLLWLCLG